MTITRNVKGLLGTKLGMTQVWDADNKLIRAGRTQRRHPAAQ
jgi:ribosomal protein L3